MILRTIRRLFRAEGQEQISTPAHEQAAFILQYGELDVGHLRLREKVWKFEYSPQFRLQVGDPEGVQPLVEFPDFNEAYESEDLWPFFSARIPSVAQPQIREEIERRGLDETSAAQLLKAFGERSIANPFRLFSA